MESSFPKVFVIILNFNGVNVLPNCLNSVFQSDYQNFETVVVDNDSNDGSFETARQQYSRAHFIKNSANMGFSKGNNVGIRYALEKFADFVFILNNDTVIEKSTLSSLIKVALQNQDAGIISPVILNPDNKTAWFAGGKIDWRKMRTFHLHESTETSPYSSEYISGCAMLIKKEVFKKIGLFDERFFLYYEDADFSLRASKKNFNLLIDPSTHIQHFEQSSQENPAKVYWLVLSALIFFQTHASFAQKLWLFPYLLIRKAKNFFDIHFSKNLFAADVKQAYKDFKKVR